MGKIILLATAIVILTTGCGSSSSGGKSKGEKNFSANERAKAAESIRFGQCIGDACSADLSEELNNVDIDYEAARLDIRVRAISYGLRLDGSKAKRPNAELFLIYGLYGIEKSWAQRLCKSGGILDRYVKPMVVVAEDMNDLIPPMIMRASELADAVLAGLMEPSSAKKEWDQEVLNVKQRAPYLLERDFIHDYSALQQDLAKAIGKSSMFDQPMYLLAAAYDSIWIAVEAISKDFSVKTRAEFVHFIHREKENPQQHRHYFKQLLEGPPRDLKTLKESIPETILFYATTGKTGGRNLLKNSVEAAKNRFGANDQCFSRNCHELIAAIEKEIQPCLSR